MKNIHYILFALLVLFSFHCKETTEPDQEALSSPATNVVINELFTIDSSKYYSHWWLELYNPTGKDIIISGWKIKFVNANKIINFNEQSALTVFEKGAFILITSSTSVFNDYWNVAPLTTLLDFKKEYSPLKVSEEIQIIDNNDKVISVFRYGNYCSSGTDQFPNNKSYGIVSEWHSFCRYADPKGAYDTGNSQNDFFEESAPVAGYYSQRMKK